MINKFIPEKLVLERMSKVDRESGRIPPFTMSYTDKEYNGHKIRSMYLEYMDCVDEYEAAIRIAGSKANWNRMLSCKWFREGWPGYKTYKGIEVWRQDMSDRDESIAKRALVEKAKEGDTNAASKLWQMIKDKQPKQTKGRPKKEDIAKAAKDHLNEKESLVEDLKRLNVVPIRG